MKILHSWEELSGVQAPIHWALGFFDGMHRGHQAVIASTQQERAAKGVLSGMLSFAEHPMLSLCPERAPKLLTPHQEQRVALAAHYGVDVLLLLPFTPELMQLSAEDFLLRLETSCTVHGVSSGSNWHFGHRGQGNADYLRRYAQEKGWQVHVEELLSADKEIISSTHIRQHLKAGELSLVTRHLGRPFALMGDVVLGQQLARQWGYPTANIPLSTDYALPPAGVYAVDALLDGKRVRGVANLGMRPTIEEKDKVLLLETHFFDWDGDLYGQSIEVNLHHFIRAEKKFSSLEELKAQIAADAQQAREFPSDCVPHS